MTTSRFYEIRKSLSKDSLHFTDSSLTVFFGDSGFPYDCVGSFVRIDDTHIGFSQQVLTSLMTDCTTKACLRTTSI